MLLTLICADDHLQPILMDLLQPSPFTPMIKTSHFSASSMEDAFNAAETPSPRPLDTLDLWSTIVSSSFVTNLSRSCLSSSMFSIEVGAVSLLSTHFEDFFSCQTNKYKRISTINSVFSISNFIFLWYIYRWYVQNK